MTKEDRQIIDRAIKENWRTGDRTRLKRLLEKNLKLYRENAELREKVNILDNCDRLGDVITEAYKEQLTKAKDLLTRFVMASVYFNGKEADLVKEAEQFLKEIEK